MTVAAFTNLAVWVAEHPARADRCTAFHEAGHAVVSWRLGFRPERLTIGAPAHGGRCSRPVVTAAAPLVASVLAAGWLAGRVADPGSPIVLHGFGVADDPDGHVGPFTQVIVGSDAAKMLALDLEADVLNRVMEWTQAELRSPRVWRVVVAVAEALLAERDLGPADLAELLPEHRSRPPLGH